MVDLFMSYTMSQYLRMGFVLEIPLVMGPFTLLQLTLLHL